MDTVLQEESYISLQYNDISEIDGFVRVLDNILSQEECTEIIRIAEEKGFVPASLYTDKDGVEHFSETRKSHRCIIDSDEFAARLWKRLQPFIPAKWIRGETVVGINPRLRLLRYDPGDEFKPHSDGSYTDQQGNTSKITILIYLNDGYENGYTAFLSNDSVTWISILPKPGRVAMQDQTLLHCVPPLTNGRKYAMRTEVMYCVETREFDCKVFKLNETNPL